MKISISCCYFISLSLWHSAVINSSVFSAYTAAILAPPGWFGKTLEWCHNSLIANSPMCECENENTFVGVSDFMAVTFCKPFCGLTVNVNSVIREEEDKGSLRETEREGNELKGQKN